MADDQNDPPGGAPPGDPPDNDDTEVAGLDPNLVAVFKGLSSLAETPAIKAFLEKAWDARSTDAQTRQIKEQNEHALKMKQAELEHASTALKLRFAVWFWGIGAGTLAATAFAAVLLMQGKVLTHESAGSIAAIIGLALAGVGVGRTSKPS